MPQPADDTDLFRLLHAEQVGAVFQLRRHRERRPKIQRQLAQPAEPLSRDAHYLQRIPVDEEFFPTMSGSPPNLFFHAAELSTTTGALPGAAASSGSNVRPRTAFTPSM